jgi:YndJ-like protein
LTRSCSTICLPVGNEFYLDFVEDPRRFRCWLDQSFRDHPEWFPKAFAQGYRLKDDRTSAKRGLRLRRVRLRSTGVSYTVRPSFVLPSMTGSTDDVQGPLFLRAFGVPFWAISHVLGSGWALLDRLSLRPLDFEPAIVLLTAIHFHYAGFVLPLLTGILLQDEKGMLARVAGVGVLVGIPLVAIGITTTQLQWGTPLEVLSAWVLGGAGLIVACLLLRQGLRSGPTVRVLWLIAGVSLAGSMVLAILYGSRPFVGAAWLDIRTMRAIHGTANALGFALCGLVGARVRQVMGM